MTKRTVMTVIFAMAMIVAWNGWLLLDWAKVNVTSSGSWSNAPGEPAESGANTGTQEQTKLWQEIKKTVVTKSADSTYEPEFTEYVTESAGKRVELPGVGFLLSSGLRDTEDGEEEVTEFLLMPGDGGVAWCCGLSPIPRLEFSVFVECKNTPFSAEAIDPKSPAFFVNVQGTLRLRKDNPIQSLYTLEDVDIEFLEVQDVLPPNVMNQCLNKPMLP